MNDKQLIEVSVTKFGGYAACESFPLVQKAFSLRSIIKGEWIWDADGEEHHFSPKETFPQNRWEDEVDYAVNVFTRDPPYPTTSDCIFSTTLVVRNGWCCEEEIKQIADDVMNNMSVGAAIIVDSLNRLSTNITLADAINSGAFQRFMCGAAPMKVIVTEVHADLLRYTKGVVGLVLSPSIVNAGDNVVWCIPNWMKAVIVDDDAQEPAENRFEHPECPRMGAIYVNVLHLRPEFRDNPHWLHVVKLANNFVGYVLRTY